MMVIGDGGKMETSKIGKTKTVVFSFLASQASHVSVAGDFNGWDQKTYPMKKDFTGVWKLSIDLAPGEYEYRFVVDGVWQTDPHKDSIPNPLGSVNNVIRVE